MEQIIAKIDGMMCGMCERDSGSGSAGGTANLRGVFE